ncbi:hypothetical protein BcabD6B2_58770 (apicoplast) [Babesia caballi]|uniref:Ribosomal protein S17 n=1 Tax=Babesia caballi TaxID=5871 RepID=A0AAV4M3L5_BABCB|nr:hypothetical protein BcabD6B2_58770 [Babesia caballi]
MVYIVINKYHKSLGCYNIKYKKHSKYKRILKINKYTKIKDPRSEFDFNNKVFKNKKNIVINKYDKF